MRHLALTARTREQILRRLDVMCALILTLNVFIVIIYFMSGSGRTLRSDDRSRRSDGIKCPSLIVNTAARVVFPRLEDSLSLVDVDYQLENWNSGLFVDEAPAHNETSRPVCPEFPIKSKGELVCTCETVTPEYVMSLWPKLEVGGRLQPTDCRARERLAIIIPFRNRTSHLHILLNNLLLVLDRQDADATIFVIEQTSPSIFNRAALHNIGFLESQKVASFDCYIFHDVDLVPLDDRILYRCSDSPRHFAVSIQRVGNRHAKPMYDEYYGGIVALTGEQYRDVNGNSNLYFGWGGEDDDLRQRVLNRGYQTKRENPDIFRFQMLHHERNDRSNGNIDRLLLLRTAEDRQDFEGLSTTKYRVVETRVLSLYMWVSVTLNMTELLLTAPDYARSSVKSLLEISRTIT